MDREETIKVLDYHLYSVPKPLSNAIASAIALLKDQETVEHALEVLKANGWKNARQRDFYSDEIYSVIKKKE